MTPLMQFATQEESENNFISDIAIKNTKIT
jgi:hypothetical protein